jgi:serine/threonine protein kinase
LQYLGADQDELAELDEYDSTLANVGAAAIAANLILPQLTGYLITDRIGEGAMGVVYRATHIATKRTVALKILSSNDSRVIERFQAEAHAGARQGDGIKRRRSSDASSCHSD